MTNSIAPPPELVQQWLNEVDEGNIFGEHLATQAAQWGADCELNACCEWLDKGFGDVGNFPATLRAARRPKPPSLKEQALDELHISFDRCYLKKGSADIIRRALEALPDD